MRRRVSRMKYFNGEVELENVRWLCTDDAGKPLPTFGRIGDRGERFGTPVGADLAAVRDHTISSRLDYRVDWLPVQRAVKFITKPDPHQCDFRCLGAKPGGVCWCACGGKNHGRNFTCN